MFPCFVVCFEEDNIFDFKTVFIVLLCLCCLLVNVSDFWGKKYVFSDKTFLQTNLPPENAGERKLYKVGASSSGKPGTLRRFIRVIQQLSVNYDFHTKYPNPSSSRIAKDSAVEKSRPWSVILAIDPSFFDKFS